MKHKSIKIFINYFLGPILFIWLSWSIYHQVQHQQGLNDAWISIKSSLKTRASWTILAVVLLMILNWSTEALKWKISVQKIQRVSFLKAFKAVLSGISFSVSTPNRVGEYLGRVLYMDEGNKLKTISLTIVGSISQLIITLLMGCIGLIVLQSEIQQGHIMSTMWVRMVISGVITVLLFLTVFYFRLGWLVKWVEGIPKLARFSYLVDTVKELNATLLCKILSLSALRYLIFLVQYYLLFSLFNVQLEYWQVIWTVSVSFLVMAVIPSIALIELVQRGKILTTVVGIFSTNTLGIGLATATIWLVNLIIPAIIGSLLILGIKRFFIKKDNQILAADIVHEKNL
jgi:uncharacterized membrane protein YbhN (UPF0104 family)